MTHVGLCREDVVHQGIVSRFICLVLASKIVGALVHSSCRAGHHAKVW